VRLVRDPPAIGLTCPPESDPEAAPRSRLIGPQLALDLKISWFQGPANARKRATGQGNYGSARFLALLDEFRTSGTGFQALKDAVRVGSVWTSSRG
jgi:hypothetical protein